MDIAVKITGAKDRTDREVGVARVEDLNARLQADADAINAESARANEAAGLEAGDEGFINPVVAIQHTTDPSEGAVFWDAVELYMNWVNAQTWASYREEVPKEELRKRDVNKWFASAPDTQKDQLLAWIAASEA